MNISLFEDNEIDTFFPFTLTRHLAELRWGALTIKEKWESRGHSVRLHSNRNWMGDGTPAVQDELYVNAACCPTKEFMDEIFQLQTGEGIKSGEKVLAFRGDMANLFSMQFKESQATFQLLTQRTDLFSQISAQLEQDMSFCIPGNSASLASGNLQIGDEFPLYISPNAKVNGAMLNVTEGPIWIDDDAEIMEGSLIRGPFYLGKHSAVKMGAKIYGPTAIGPHCKVGGELGNVSFQGYSNKAHDGFLGNSVIGQWCNLGADTNCSNLKNNYSIVKQYNYRTRKEESTGLNFCGLMMGDYSKCGINTMWNTGSVVGVSVNFYGAGFPKKFLPNFYWGDANHGERYDLEKALETISIVKRRRGLELSQKEKEILTDLHAQSVVSE